MRKPLSAGIAIAGLLIALVGIGSDYLLPGASPGLNLPQLLVIAGGLLIAVLPKLLKAMPAGRDVAGRLPFSAAAAAIFITLLTLAGIEFVLALLGFSTYFPADARIIEVTVAPWWTCDAVVGCRFEHEAARDACAAGQLRGRSCLVNAQGYADSEDFVVTDDYAGRARILALGDSFAHGLSADLGKSYVETVEASLPGGALWNMGISGTGTSQAVAAFAQFAPQLKPQLAILGFYMNDFGDNLIPLEGRMQFTDADGRLHFVHAATRTAGAIR